MELCWETNISAFNKLSCFVIAFLPRSKHLLISWLQSPSTVIVESNKITSVTISIVSQFICHEVMGPGDMILVSWMLNFKPAFPLSSFTFIKKLFISSFLFFAFCHKGSVVCISEVIGNSPSNLYLNCLPEYTLHLVYIKGDL